MKLDQHTMLLPKRRKTQSNISPQKMQDKKSAQENSTTRLATATAHTASHTAWCGVRGAMAVAPGEHRVASEGAGRRGSVGAATLPCLAVLGFHGAQ